MAAGADPSRPAASQKDLLHASCVAVEGKAVLIQGASGSGKSGLALQLMALGCALVADDRTVVWRAGDTVWVNAPDRLRGLIEAREVGILRVPATGAQPLALIVDMNTSETERLPPWHCCDISGVPIPVLRKSELPHFPAAITTYLRGQREA
ncbi:MAG: HPr kinase/phosphatase C-terminal domain-containing protein [Pseudomonadota bacterium]